MRKIIIESMSYRNQSVPRGAIDCRGLKNPHNDMTMRKMTGRDQKVKDFVLSSSDAERLLMQGMLLAEGNQRIVFACVGGKHRSVALAEELADRLIDLYSGALDVEVKHYNI